MSNLPSILAIDVGSSRVKLGWFPAAGACTSDKPAGNLPIAAPALAMPDELFQVQHKGRAASDSTQSWPQSWLDEIERWCDGLPAPPDSCLVASVHRSASAALVERLQRRPSFAVRQLEASDLPLVVRVDQPARVGIDRLLGALAVNHLRRADHPAISIDMGTAITVDLISADGAFEGGAILAGPTLSLAALHAGTSSLPALDDAVLTSSPPPIGKHTAAAMASGAFWGAAGGVSELVRRIASECPAPPEVFLTGGASHAFASLIELAGRPARHVPHLVLAGIRLAAAAAP